MNTSDTINPGSEDEKEVLTLLHCAAVEGRKEVVAFTRLISEDADWFVTMPISEAVPSGRFV